MRHPARHDSGQNPDKRSWSILLLILVAALVLRLATIDFGLPALNDPDELMFELGAMRMLRGLTLNPGWFGHPATTTIYVLALVDIGAFGAAWLTGAATSVKAFGALVYANPGWIILPGRVAMALFALGTIVLVWRLAGRFAGNVAGLVAAAVLAVSPVHVTYSQIIRSDMMACFFMLLCIDAATTIAQDGKPATYRWAALWWGLAIATKWPFALAGLAIAGATLVVVRSRRVTPTRGLMLAAGATGMALIVLVGASPFLVLDHATVLRNLRGESQLHHLGATSEGIWWNLRWYATGPILTGLGWAGLLLSLCGVARLLRHRVAASVIVPVAVSFVLILSTQHLVWERWALPLLPLAAILAGIAVADLVRASQRWRSRAILPVFIVAILALVLVPSVMRVRADDRARRTDTRQLAAAWAHTHVAPGSTVLVEHFAFDMLAEPWRFLFPLGDAGCVDARAFLQGKVPYAVIESARGARSNVDYGTVAPSERATCRTDVAILTQADRYRREQSRFPAEYDAYRMLIQQGRVAAIFKPQSGQIGGPVVTVIYSKNTKL